MSTRSSARPSRPDFSFEEQFEGPVCGLDEVGRGPLAGPVVAACVYVPPEKRELEFVAKITDSKKLSEARLAELYGLIAENFVFGVAEVSVEEIDAINILQASLLAMRRAFLMIDGVMPAPAQALVDGNHCPELPCPATPIIKGDSRSVSIAAASILAKVHRDRLMAELAAAHPHYGWERNAGYPSPEHLRAIDAHGITPHHRRSYAPVRNFIEFGATSRQVALAI